MRKTIPLLICIFLSLNLNAQNSKAILSFGWIVRGGDHIYNMSVTSKLKNIEAAFGKDKSNFDAYPSIWKREYIVSKDAVKHILKYVSVHCDATKYPRTINESYYKVSFFLNGKLTVCNMKDRNASLLYYKDLKQWIEMSPYKKECRKIIRAIQETYINEKGFPFARILQRNKTAYCSKYLPHSSF